MKKPLKIILWITGILLGLIILGVAAYLIYFFRATSVLTPGETGSFNDTVWCIKDRYVNCYIFKGDQDYLMVDAGFGGKNFVDELEKTGINLDQIKTLLLTHTDSDHTGATGLLTNPAIYMNRDEEQMINGTTGKMKYFKTIWKYGPYKLLSDNDTLTIDGLKIKILHTPGHTPGSSCYVIGNDYLVSGDNLAVKDGEYDHFIDKFNMDTPRQIESLKSLPSPGSFKYILTGHYGPIKTNN
jgi:hydroxyacylglutathione hydrolase